MHRWHPLGLAARQLSLPITLTCGQSFRWLQLQEGRWGGVVAGSLVLLRQRDGAIEFSPVNCGVSVGEMAAEKHARALLLDYFNASAPLESMYEEWSRADARFKQLSTVFSGLRVLRQDPHECLFSFLCSSNNNIMRITLMLNKLCVACGTRLGTVDGHDFHSFPSLERLCQLKEEELRGMGFGYRAKFIVESARIVRECGGGDWLQGLRLLPYEHVREQLLQLQGVGRKVADCVALFSLDKTDAVPVDTHVWDITQSLYAQHLQKTTKSLTPKMYDDIRAVWRATFGSHSGWAQAILFAGELTRYRQLLQDHGCSPALGVAIKEERREAAASLPNSPQKPNSVANSPMKAKASPAVAPSPSPGAKVPKPKREKNMVGSSAVHSDVSAAHVEGVSAAAAADAVVGTKKRVVRLKLKLEPGAGADADAGAGSDADARPAESARGGTGAAKRVKRERGA